jgi:hypothetical protein
MVKRVAVKAATPERMTTIFPNLEPVPPEDDLETP